MFRRRHGITQSQLPKLLAKGYGQGEGENYKPMIHIQDFPSKGWRNRERGWKSGRQHDYFSSHELKYHYHLDWSNIIHDFKEQFPLLPIGTTIEIANQLGIHHPTDRKTKEPIVMTTDFLIKIKRPIGFIEQVRTIKPVKELKKNRTLEKLEIERRFWQIRGINWAIVTENEIDDALANNVKWIHKFISPTSLRPLTDKSIQRTADTLTQMMFDVDDSFSNIALACDEKLELRQGYSLATARHLIASRQWQVDMTKTIHTSEKLTLLGASLKRGKT